LRGFPVGRDDGPGAEYVLFFGGAGALAPEIRRGEIIVPSRAIRGEGTSFHYRGRAATPTPAKPCWSSSSGP
ncbi:TPA: hypothetical protein EYP44_03835, partial [Candidatus Bathyarchaeota archaeon]|nr:hypothetical protein [Candidatus Bathyarchaeota archaeon]